MPAHGRLRVLRSMSSAVIRQTHVCATPVRVHSCAFALLVMATQAVAGDPSPRERLVELRASQREARTKVALSQVATDALDIAGDALSADDQRTAIQAISLAKTIAGGIGNKFLALVCSQQQDEVRLIGRATTDLRRTIRNIDSGAASAEELTAGGKFYGLLRNDWKTAIPLLQKSEDSTVKQAAALEAIGPVGPDQEVELATAWAAIAASETGILQARAFARSHHWFRQALAHAPDDRAEEIRSKMEVLPFRYLTDMTPSNAAPGPWPLGRYGNAGAGAPIKVNGLAYPLGIGLHPPDSGFASVQYTLDGKYDSLFLGVALNDANVNFGGKEIVFWVIGDGKPLWKSSIQERGVADAQVIDISGVNLLELRTQAPGSAFGSHAVWLDPMLIK
jgi:NPCBM/NEW2 domain